MNILLTGGTGFIGAELCPMLLREGHYLTIITRHPTHHNEEQSKNQQFISWQDDLVEAMEQADAVINLAGENIFGQRWSDEVKKRIYTSRINTTHQLVEAIKKATTAPEVIISASAAGYYGGRGTDILTEKEPAGHDFLAQVCVDWEKAAKSVQQAGVRLVHPRIGVVLEKGGGALEQMLPAFNLFVGGSIGSGTQFVPWIHRHDLCRGLLFPLRNKQIEGPYNLASPNPVTMKEFATAMGEVLNRPSFFGIPEFVLKVVLGEASKPVVESLRPKPKKLQDTGFTFQFNYIREALSEIL